MTRLQLTTALDTARRAVSTATSTKARTKAIEELEKATVALADFDAGRTSATSAPSGKPASKTTYVKKEERYEEEEEEEEDEEEDEEEEEDDEPKKPMEDDDSDEDEESEDEDDDDKGDDDDDDDDDEEEEEEKAKAVLTSARASLKLAKASKSPKAIASARAVLQAAKAAHGPGSTFATLLATARRVTGKHSLRSVLGALEGLAASAKKTEELSARVERSERSALRQRVSTMVKSAARDGRIAASEVESLKADGLKMGTKWLKAHLNARPKMARTTEDGPLHGKSLRGGTDADAARAELLDAQNMSAETRTMVESMATAAGKSFDEFVADMNKNARKRSGA